MVRKTKQKGLVNAGGQRRMTIHVLADSKATLTLITTLYHHAEQKSNSEFRTHIAEQALINQEQESIKQNHQT